jgi:tRNA uridine 5-carbamoylmethylation protein Kti12
MTLILLIGPPAVGKMTVGQELAKLTGLKLFHNHMSLELVNQFFDFGTEAFDRLDKTIRFAIFEEVAKSDLKGLIFTLVWDYSFEEDEAYVNEIIQIFREQDAQICLVELQADLEVRLERNRHEHRLKHKPSKRDVEWSENYLQYSESNFRMRSMENEFEDKEIFQIDNTHLLPEEVALMIKGQFNL